MRWRERFENKTNAPPSPPLRPAPAPPPCPPPPALTSLHLPTPHQNEGINPTPATPKVDAKPWGITRQHLMGELNGRLKEFLEQASLSSHSPHISTPISPICHPPFAPCTNRFFLLSI